ncbi:MAG: RNA polymerase, partial [Planctomycetes bacterium]|nr:RNA polymerase [Planctomycetota bacterium]
EAVLLFYFDQKNLAEIGQVLGITAAAVSQRLHRARQHLRQVLGVEEGA